jgi:hypothetical protein
VGFTQPAQPGDGEHQIRQLEGRYIELLEKRVADLERLVSKQAEEVRQRRALRVLASLLTSRPRRHQRRKAAKVPPRI